MKYDRNIHDLKHLTKHVLGKLEFSLSSSFFKSGELLVLNYHGTPERFINSFEKQVDFVANNFNIISPFEIKKYFDHSIQSIKPMALFTFDDGLKNNLSAYEILKQKKIKSVFFVIPGFIDTEEAKQKEYYLKNVRSFINNSIDNKEEDFKVMTWNDLKILASDGNEIGSHSYSHTLIASEDNKNKAEHEIVESKVRIQEMLNINVTSFCGPNNSLVSVGSKEMDMIRLNYEYFYTTFPGSNVNTSPFFIRRSNVEAFWMRGAFLNSIGKWDRIRWTKKADEFLNKTIKG